MEGTSTGSLTRSASCRMDKPLFWRVDLPEARSELVGWRKLWELIGVMGDGSENGFVCCKFSIGLCLNPQKKFAVCLLFFCAGFLLEASTKGSKLWSVGNPFGSRI